MEELIKSFGINWKLLTAQVVNFAILFWLLKRFAYSPLLGVLKQRESKIREGLSMAKEAEEKLKRIDSIEEEKKTEVEVMSLRLMADTESRAKDKEAELILAAKTKSDALLDGAKRIILQEKNKMLVEVEGQSQEMVKEALKRVLERTETDKRDEALILEVLGELSRVAKTA